VSQSVEPQSAPTPRRWVLRVQRWTLRHDQSLPYWLSVPTVGILLAGAWGLTYAAGGARTALPHLFYVPIVLAARPFGRAGGLVTALVATLLCGPLLPLSVATGEPQSLSNWLVRGGFFITVSVLASLSLSSVRRSYERELTAQFRQEIEGRSAARDAPDDQVIARLWQTIEGNLFHPVFQPIYSLEEGRLLAVEALTRFDATPQRPPNVWFDEAAGAGLGLELELATIGAALDASRSLPTEVAVSINCSPDTLASPKFLELIGTRGSRAVIVEVTEHAVVDDYELLAAALHQLRACNVRIAVDDAGAGIASLRHIVQLAPDIIKLDISLTQNVRSNPMRRALARALIEFAQQTGTELLTEGIEVSADLLAWRELGAHAAQGYLLGRPGPLPVPTVNRLITELRPSPSRSSKPPPAGTAPNRTGQRKLHARA
jgi:EAL domain-containing protein (putative c-di-GMP-specific phosphodiesterase class I)